MPAHSFHSGKEMSTHRLRGLRRDDAGMMMAPLAIMMPILLGIVGLSIDLGSWYNAKRQVQAAADAAARAGALELVRDHSAKIAKQAALEDAAAYGLGQNDININMPPLSGLYLGDDDAVEVVVQRRPESFFSTYVFDFDVMVEARAVGKVVSVDTCIWALEEHEPGLQIVGTADVQLDCGIQVNSDHEMALDQVGSSCVTATSIRVVGGASGDCLMPLPVTGVLPAADPLADLDPPGHAGCTYTQAIKVVKNTTLSPGVYCGGINISGNADITFDPGIYVLKGGTFKAVGGSSLQGSEVTFYLTDNANLDVSAASIDFSAPDSGDMEGILFFQDRFEASTIANKIVGNAELELDGALYFPTAELHLRGKSSAAVPTPMIIARTIRFVGTTSLGGNGAPPLLSVVEAKLVE